MKQKVKKLIIESQRVNATDIHFMLSDTIQKCDLRGIKGFKEL